MGCTDSHSDGYDPLATDDDGTCPFYVSGCTQFGAINYRSAAEVDDGSCKFYRPGCMDGDNFLDVDPLANAADVSMCKVPIVRGCSDTIAANFDNGVNMDDGSCRYAGCTDSRARNFDTTATVGDDGCKYDVEGCMDEEGYDYRPAANAPTSCRKGGCMLLTSLAFDSKATFDGARSQLLIQTIHPREFSSLSPFLLTQPKAPHHYNLTLAGLLPQTVAATWLLKAAPTHALTTSGQKRRTANQIRAPSERASAQVPQITILRLQFTTMASASTSATTPASP